MKTAINPVVTSPIVGAGDRLSFALVIAFLLHLLIILGVSFSLPDGNAESTTLDVTLAQSWSDEAPDEADFLAQQNQLGSGSLEKRTEQTTTEQADFAAQEINQTQPDFQQASAPKPNQKSQQVITVLHAKNKVHPDEIKQEIDALELPEGITQSLLERSLEIASLEAKLDYQQQLDTKRPRVSRLTTTSTMANDEAGYMYQWLRRIEQVGNLHYPDEAYRNRIFGSLRILVAVRANGTIDHIEVLESSGHTVLDDAAKRIVHLAAPFAPFPEAMRRKSDVIEIIRTWQFKEKHFSSNI
jgi:periplasmic protein TonB